MLKAGDIGYGFLYKSTCINYDIRFIQLPREIISAQMTSTTQRQRFPLKISWELDQLPFVWAGYIRLSIPDNATNLGRCNPLCQVYVDQ